MGDWELVSVRDEGHRLLGVAMSASLHAMCFDPFLHTEEIGRGSPSVKPGYTMFFGHTCTPSGSIGFTGSYMYNLGFYIARRPYRVLIRVAPSQQVLITDPP